MTLHDFIKKYHITYAELADKLHISQSRVYVILQGGCHRSISKYAPIVESMVPDCKDKIYIPPKEDETIRYKRVEKIPFTSEEIELVKLHPNRVPYRTQKKIFNGHLFSRNVHDKIIKRLKEDKPITKVETQEIVYV